MAVYFNKVHNIAPLEAAVILIRQRNSIFRHSSCLGSAGACLWLIIILVIAAGCSHPARWINEPHYIATVGQIGPTALAGYDTNDDGRIDYLQILDPHGRKRHLFFDRNHDGEFDHCFDLAELEDTSRHRTLLVLLDGISYPLVEQLRAEGRFRLFYPPGRLIGGFPTVTDTIFADFFETPRPFGYEAAYLDLDTGRKAGGASFYLRGGNEPVWPRQMLYRQSYLYDGLVYVLHNWAAQRELNYSIKATQKWLDDDDAHPLAAIYMVNTDAIGHDKGHEALKDFLRLIDTALEKLVWQSRGRLRIVVLADHGINEANMRRVELQAPLEAAGFNIADRLGDPRDVHIPAFGLVSHVSIYTRMPYEVARTAAAIEGVELAAYHIDAISILPPAAPRPTPGAVFVVDGRGGHAAIERRHSAADTQRSNMVPADADRTQPHTQYRYRPTTGDPLLLLPIMARMRAAGLMGDDGWASAQAWLDATWDHRWSDPVVRLSHAFYGNVTHPSQVLLSLAPEYYYGQTKFDLVAGLSGTHGSLHSEATVTFVLSNFFQPPPYQRVHQLRDDLKQRLGLETLLPKP